MLKFYSVPKGSCLDGFSTSSGINFSDIRKSTGVRVASFIPFGGKSSRLELESDPGYLHQGDDHGGLKDVEHLNVTGDIFSLSFSNGTSNRFSSEPFPNLFGNVISVPMADRVGRRIVAEFNLLCAYGSSASKNVDFSTSYYHPYGKQQRIRRSIYIGWFTGHVQIYCQLHRWWDSKDYSADGTWGSVSVFAKIYNSDFSAYDYKSLGPSKSMMRDLLSSSWTAEQAINAMTSFIEQRIHSVDFPMPQSEYRTLLDGSISDRQDVQPLIRHTVFSVDLNPDWGMLASDCYSQVRLWNNNGLAYSQDIFRILSSGKSTVSTVKSLVTGRPSKKMMNDLASLFLSFYYGWRLTTKDTISLIRGDYSRVYPRGLLKRSTALRYLRGRASVTARVSVYTDPYSSSLSDLDHLLRDFDLEPTLENLWDLVPFSFVVDWFTNVGDVLTRLDQIAQLDSYQVRLSGRSIKAETFIEIGELIPNARMFGSILASFYTRQYSTTPIAPSLISFRNSNQKFDHWLESSALIVQRLT